MALSQGASFSPSELTPAHIDAAIDFVLAVNARPRARRWRRAPKPVSAWREHIATVERRVARLAALDPDAPHAEEAQSFVSTRSAAGVDRRESRAWQRTRAPRAWRWSSALSPDECCLSPSDFGFHNALVDDAGKRDVPRFRICRPRRSGQAGIATSSASRKFRCRSTIIRRLPRAYGRGVRAWTMRDGRAAACCSTPTGSNGPASSSTISCRSARRAAPSPMRATWAARCASADCQGRSEAAGLKD